MRLLILFLFFFGFSVSAADGSGEFNPSDMIIHHISDAHEIHIMTLFKDTDKEFHISVPLPVILYTEDKGLEVFSSSQFHNAEKQYGRYKLYHEKIYIAEDGYLDFDAAGHPNNAKPFLDLSITKTVAGVLIACLLMIWIFTSVASAYAKRAEPSAPRGLQGALEPFIIFIRDDMAKACIGEKHYERFMPYLLSVFFFIWISNLLGLIPFIGGFNITGNISIALVLAAFTFLVTNLSGNKHYWRHIFAMPGVPPFVLLILTPIEILGVLSKGVVLMVRLFANIMAGHIIILSFVSLIFIFSGIYGSVGGYGASVVSLAFAVFMNVLEILVAFLQAYIFTLLSALYFGIAVEEHH